MFVICAGKKLKNVDTLIANVNDNQSMDAMCQQGKVLLNCVGPVRTSDFRSRSSAEA